METGDGRIEKEARNDEGGGRFARQTAERGDDPEQSRDNANMQSGNGEKMECPGFLKRCFDIVRRFVPQTERHSIDQRDDFGRVLEPAAQSRAHPFPRPGCAPDEKIAPAALEDDAILPIAREDTLENIAPREVGSKIEPAGIPRALDRFDDAFQCDLVPEPGVAFPAHPDRSRARFLAGPKIERFKLKQEGGKVVRRGLRFAGHDPPHRNRPHPPAQPRLQGPAGRIRHLNQMEDEENGGDQEVSQPGDRAHQNNDRAERDAAAEEVERCGEKLSEQDSADRAQGQAKERLPGRIERLHREEI